MPSFSLPRRVLALALLVPLFPLQTAHGQAKAAKGVPVNFETVDGVKIVGSYWAGKEGKNAPVVLLLHDFKKDKGGNRAQDGWESLAQALNGKGYAVLSFDFRGHGESTSVNAMTFWAFPFNKNLIRVKGGLNPARLPEAISQGDFTTPYFTYLVNDITAAKAFLDRKNDGGELNSSNLIVIGAGEGATLGTLWMATEWRMQRGMTPPGVIGPVVDPRLIKFDPPDGKDFVCAVWLGMSPSVGGRNMPVRQWLLDVGKQHKVPMAFLYGTEDTAADQRALAYLRDIIPGYERGKPIKDDAYRFMGEYGLKTKLVGSQLLDKNLDTEKWIVDTYVKLVLDKHQIAEWRDRESTKSLYYWVFPGMVVPAKRANDLAPQPVPLLRFGVQ